MEKSLILIIVSICGIAVLASYGMITGQINEEAYRKQAEEEVYKKQAEQVAQPIPEPEYQDEESSDFAKSKESVLSVLVKIEQSHNFDIVFDKDLTSRQEEGAIFHTYKIIHETDRRIGDLTFYSGKPNILIFPSTDFDKIFRVKIYISTESGVSPTSAGLPIIKSSLEELMPEWSMIKKDQTSSEWIDSVLQSQGDSSGEKTETISSDQQEIRFSYNEKGLGFVELIITQKIS